MPQLPRVLNMNQMPDWVQSLFEAIGSTIEFKGLANLEARFSAADETAWGTDLLEIRPAVVDLADHGLIAGEVAYGIIHAFDLKAVVEMFDGIAAFSFGIENDGCPCFTIEGQVKDHDIIVLIYIEPFEDSEATPLE